MRKTHLRDINSPLTAIHNPGYVPKRHLTNNPDEVTCKQCLVMMGRREKVWKHRRG